MKKRMSADNISGRDVSKDSARRDGRDRKHEFLHFLFPLFVAFTTVFRGLDDAPTSGEYNLVPLVTQKYNKI